ncbi:MAG: insulinase family protein, partial [Bryobacteraceae bacterium]
DIENVPIDRLQAFYRKWYQPDNAMLVVAGKFDQAKTLDWIANSFGKIPKPTRVIQKTYTTEPTQDGERSVTLRRVGDTQSVVAMYHVPAGSHPDYEAVQVLTAVLGETPSGRLYKALVENKLATSASGADLPLREPGVVFFTANLRKEQSLDAARETLLKTLDAIAKEPPSKEEVDRAKTRLVKQVELDLNNAENIGVELSEWASMGDWRLLFLQRDKLKAVTPADVARVAKAYLKPSNRTLGQFIPEATPDRSEIPAAPDSDVLLKDFKGGAAVAAGESFDPSFANIDTRTQRFTLPNGMKLALLPKKTRGGSVNAVLTLHFGELDALRGQAVPGSAAGLMLMRGTTQKTRQQIQDALDKMKARMNVAGAASSASASIDTVHDSLPDALRLAAEVLRQPAFPEREFEQWKQSNIANLERAKSEPQTLATVAINKHLQIYPPDDIRAPFNPDEQIERIKAVTLDDAKKFYAKFYGASNAELAVVGDFDAAEVHKLAAELFGDWKSKAPYKHITKVYATPPPINRMIEAPDKANAFFYAATNLKLREEDPDYPAIDFAVYVMGGGLKGRMPMRIREKEGLSYGVQTVLVAPDKDTGSTLIMVAICAPENALKVEAAFKDELDKILKDGYSADEVEKFKASWKQEQQIFRTQDGALARHLATNEANGRTMAYDKKQEDAVLALSTQQLNDILRKWVKTADFSIVKAGDFKKKGITQ